MSVADLSRNVSFALTRRGCNATLRPDCYIPEVVLNKSGSWAPRKPYFLLLLFALFFSFPSSAATRKIIFDTDPRTDDAMALMLALNSPELDVRAITVVPGNVAAKQGLENALRMVSLANRCDIPVAAGAQHPLFQKLITAEFWHGKNGLANIELPPSKCKVDSRYGPDLIIELVHAAPHEITLVPVGPLTNIALAVEKDPSIVPLVEPNAKVCVDADAERFLQLFVSRIRGK